MKTIREICENCSSVLIEKLEAREAERDAAERERVKAILSDRLKFQVAHVEELFKYIYPPPKPEKLPAGWYGVKGMVGEPFPHVFESSFVPNYGHEYRPISNPFDPPPEVTDKAEKPTFEEWCAVNVPEFDCKLDTTFVHEFRRSLVYLGLIRK